MENLELKEDVNISPNQFREYVDDVNQWLERYKEKVSMARMIDSGLARELESYNKGRAVFYYVGLFLVLPINAILYLLGADSLLMLICSSMAPVIFAGGAMIVGHTGQAGIRKSKDLVRLGWEAVGPLEDQLVNGMKPEESSPAEDDVAPEEPSLPEEDLASKKPPLPQEPQKSEVLLAIMKDFAGLVRKGIFIAAKYLACFILGFFPAHVQKWVSGRLFRDEKYGVLDYTRFNAWFDYVLAAAFALMVLYSVVLFTWWQDWLQRGGRMATPAYNAAYNLLYKTIWPFSAWWASSLCILFFISALIRLLLIKDYKKPSGSLLVAPPYWLLVGPPYLVVKGTITAHDWFTGLYSSKKEQLMQQKKGESE